MPIRIENPFVDVTERLNPDKNPYVAKIITAMKEGTLPVKFGPALNGVAGAWQQQFAGAVDSLVVEIGSHRGETLSAMASAFPNTGFIGIDITFKRVVKTAEKAVKQNLGNVQSVLANAKTIAQLFAPGELDGAVIFFPDPWVKKVKQAKKRLINLEFAVNLRRCMKPGGYLWVKMDQETYFLEAAAHLEQGGWEPARELPPLTQRPFSSVFEKMFLQNNTKTYQSVWVNSRIDTPPLQN